jgi:hypothetical protein
MIFMYLCVNMNQVCRCDIGCHNMVVSIFFRHPKCQFMAVESTMFGSTLVAVQVASGLLGMSIKGVLVEVLSWSSGGFMP